MMRLKRVLIIGPGASGKSTLARQLAEITGLPVIELDKVFWRAGLVETPRDEWVELLQKPVGEAEWIMDGDLGPYDAIEVRLRAADTVIFLDFSLVRCAWRALRRSRERIDFWLLLLRYRRHSSPFGIGSDADLTGYDAMPPDQLKKLRASYKPNYAFRDKPDTDGYNHPKKIYDLTQALVDRRYSDDSVIAVLGGNFWRLLGAIWI